jgi:predicted DNA-binding transcriptional regulator AlpA
VQTIGAHWRKKALGIPQQEAEMNAPSHERLLRRNVVEQTTGMSRTTIYRYTALPPGHPKRFPSPVKLGRASAWPESEVLRWIEARKAERTAI